MASLPKFVHLINACFRSKEALEKFIELFTIQAPRYNIRTYNRPSSIVIVQSNFGK